MSISSYVEIFNVSNLKDTFAIHSNNIKRTSALKTLENLHECLSKNQTMYLDEKFHSPNSQLSDFELLKQKVTQIHSGYTQKQARLWWIFRLLFSNEKKIAALHIKIDQLINDKISRKNALPSPYSLPIIVSDNVQQVISYLNLQDLRAFALTSRKCRVEASKNILTLARTLGFTHTNPRNAWWFLHRQLTVNTFENCIRCGINNILKLHIKNGAGINENLSISANRVTIIAATFPLELALRCGHFETAKILLNAGVILNQVNYIQAAIEQEKDIFIKLLVGYGADIDIIDDITETTELQDAIVVRHKVRVLRLLEQGASLYKMNPRGDNALGLASRDSNQEIFTYLLKNGAKASKARMDFDPPKSLMFQI